MKNLQEILRFKDEIEKIARKYGCSSPHFYKNPDPTASHSLYLVVTPNASAVESAAPFMIAYEIVNLLQCQLYPMLSTDLSPEDKKSVMEQSAHIGDEPGLKQLFGDLKKSFIAEIGVEKGDPTFQESFDTWKIIYDKSKPNSEEAEKKSKRKRMI